LHFPFRRGHYQDFFLNTKNSNRVRIHFILKYTPG
jgi:hypothetical protein